MWNRLIGLIAVYILYLMLGTMIFLHLEAEHEQKMRTETLNASVITDIMSALKESNYSKAEIFQALRMYHLFMTPEHSLEHNNEFIVNYLRTMFFSLTLVTTIGYGNVSPKTLVGQVCSIIYAFFGMPLHMLLMMLLGDQLKDQMKRVSRWTKKRWPQSNYALPLVKTLCVCFASFLFLVGPAVVFIYTESWTFLEGFYYSFITLATVGLGDYVAGNSLLHHEFYWAYLLLLVTWVIFGLAYLSVVFGWLYEKLQKAMFRVSKCCNDLDTIRARSVTSGIRGDRNSSGTAVSGLDNRRTGEEEEEERRHVLSLTENDEVTEEHLRLLDSMIEELEKKCASKIRIMELKKNLLLSQTA